MVTWEKGPVQVIRFIRRLRGGSQPVMVEGTDGCSYVLKFSNNLQGANLPFNESAGIELFKSCGLAVPEWKPLWVTPEFLDQNPGCWIESPDERLRPVPGLCFGANFLGKPGSRLLEILPGTSFKLIRNRMCFWLAWLIDICFDHIDNRQAVFQEDAEGGLDAFFIDMGNMFGGAKGNQTAHFITSRYLDPRIYVDVGSEWITEFQKIAQALDTDGLWRRIQVLPEDWKSASAMAGFSRGLDRVCNGDLVRNVLDTIVDTHQRRGQIDRVAGKITEDSSPEILRPRIQDRPA